MKLSKSELKTIYKLYKKPDNGSYQHWRASLIDLLGLSENDGKYFIRGVTSSYDIRKHEIMNAEALLYIKSRIRLKKINKLLKNG